MILFTGINVNRKWKDDRTWFGQYAGAYIHLLWEDLLQNNHMHVQSYCRCQPIPGTEFKNAFSQVTNEASVLTGSKLVDNKNLSF
jgi:hypothetical protein